MLNTKTPKPQDTCWGKLLTGSGTSPRQRIVLQSTKLKGVGHQTWRCRVWSLPSWFLALSIIPSLWCFGMVMYILWCWKYVICFLSYRGLQLRDCSESQKKLWTLKQCWDYERLWNWTECILHYTMATGLCGLDSRMQWFEWEWSP